MRAVVLCLALALALAGCTDGGSAANDDADAAMLMMGSTAFMNGYNQARPATITCFRTGMMTTCQ